MRTEYLREFVVFSRHLSFTEAAKELFIAQSTLSTHIAALESDVGFSLIDRKAGNRLTDKGAVLSSSTITGIPSSSPSSMARPTSCSITTTRLSPRS